MKITNYQGICNLGTGMDSIYEKAINGDNTCFKNLYGYIKEDYIRAGVIEESLPEINEENYNTRCNRLILKNLELLKSEIDILINKYGKDRIGIVGATTNSGVEEYEKTKNPMHYELGSPSEFLADHLGLTGFHATVSTACSSGIKAFSLARDLLKKGVSNAIIIVCVDPLSKLPIYGFHSLDVLTNTPAKPFGKGRKGMNIGEAVTVFTVENDDEKGISVMGLGETSDIYHSTTPDPEGREEIRAIKMALKEAGITPDKVDYINAHGTGTVANDIMEATAIHKVFGDKTPVSSTKPLTGHCLGAAAGIEISLCCKLMDSFSGKLYPNAVCEEYDDTLPKIKLVKKEDNYNKCNICMCNSFGFGGTNAIIILGKNNE